LATASQSANLLLASLPAADFELLRPHLRKVEMVQDSQLLQAGEAISSVYFPHDGIVSLCVTLSSGQMVGVGMIGRDSVVGALSALEGEFGLTNAIVQLPGTASVVDAEQLRRLAMQSSALRTRLIRHIQMQFLQAQQSAACNGVHDVEARLSRWLLRVRDLCGGHAFEQTQEFLAQMIGVQRNSVSLVAHRFQQMGLIRYSRGHVEIVDAPRLQACACECYGAIRAISDTILRFDDAPSNKWRHHA
jgi:CRP-like cAMP-binding protein